jgi:hypothetical protein
MDFTLDGIAAIFDWQMRIVLFGEQQGQQENR